MKGRTSKRYKKKRHKHKSKSKLKKKKELRCSDSSHSDSDTSTTGTSSEERKRKKRKKEKRKNKLKFNVSQKDAAESDSDDIEIGPFPPTSAIINRGEVTDDITVGPLPPSNAKGNVKSLAPMTKDEWEKRQSVVKRVFDENTGRWRLVKGDGEILEEIVSRDRHKEINRQATAGDGLYFQSKTTDKMKRS
ncbi:hypothetical protein J437_LFUL011511 [Ladona fulva]|uniref:ADP-ribosylation factor-like protein 6-interacting protein 4 n=1 Tax=Ladona fulva TaxID=123851 RepID=A0A8K0P079_LADFU|nr:hypothetical protein J437_LFUL011511 [Ladona fulva]